MIQRIQSLFFLFSAISLVAIIYTFPVLQDEDSFYLLSKHFDLVRVLILFSAALSIFAIFQFRNMSRQKLISNIARFLITISVVLLVFIYREDRSMAIGFMLLIVPFLSLILANLFIRKDEKEIESSDRIR